MMGMRRSSAEEEPQEGTPEWLTTYSDLVTLLLTFFILLFSMAVIDNQKFAEVANSLRSTFIHVSSGEIYEMNKGKDLIAITQENNSVNDQELNSVEEQSRISEAEDAKALRMENFINKVEENIAEHNLGEFVKVIEEKNTVILRIGSVILFDSGRAEIKDSGKDTLRELGFFLKDLDREILIQGHTDNMPIDTFLFPTNWELSTKRATNIVIYMIENCKLDPSKLTATGNGEFKPIAPNDTEQNRAKNRRIDIVIEK